MWCKHLNVEQYDTNRSWQCKAFPNGIPEAVNYEGQIPHTRPYPGDKGVQFELQTNEELMPHLLRILLEVSNHESDVLLQMMMDVVEEGSKWNYYPERYPKKQ